MRFDFDPRKSQLLEGESETGWRILRGGGNLHPPYYQDRRSDLPEQYHAIGWVKDLLHSLIFEVREDSEGEYYHLVTLWRSTREEQKLYAENS
jgi:hypothetical protein